MRAGWLVRLFTMPSRDVVEPHARVPDCRSRSAGRTGSDVGGATWATVPDSRVRASVLDVGGGIGRR